LRARRARGGESGPLRREGGLRDLCLAYSGFEI
jgi:hypothetical protein